MEHVVAFNSYLLKQKMCYSRKNLCIQMINSEYEQWITNTKYE